MHTRVVTQPQSDLCIQPTLQGSPGLGTNPEFLKPQRDSFEAVQNRYGQPSAVSQPQTVLNTQPREMITYDEEESEEDGEIIHPSDRRRDRANNEVLEVLKVLACFLAIAALGAIAL